MKSILGLGLVLLIVLVGCGEEKIKTFDFTFEELEKRVANALQEAGDRTDLEIISTEINEDGKHVISLSNDIFIFTEVDADSDKVVKSTLGTTYDAFNSDNENYNFSTLLMVGVMDDSLSMGDRNKLINDIGIKDKDKVTVATNEVMDNNNIQYTFKSSPDEDSILLRTEPK